MRRGLSDGGRAEAGCARGRGKSYPPRARYGTRMCVWARVTSYSRPRGFPFFITRRVQPSNPALRSTAQLSNAATTTRLRHDGRTHTGASLALSPGPSLEATYPTCQPTYLTPSASTVHVSSSTKSRSGINRDGSLSRASAIRRRSYVQVVLRNRKSEHRTSFSQQIHAFDNRVKLGSPTGDDNHAGRGHATRVSRMRPTRVIEMVE